jgi:lipopolysaccharide exporter
MIRDTAFILAVYLAGTVVLTVAIYYSLRFAAARFGWAQEFTDRLIELLDKVLGWFGGPLPKTAHLPDPGLTETLPRLPVSRSTEAPGQESSLLREPADLSARARRGAFWDASRTLVIRLTNLIITAIVAHILTRHDFGVFAVAMTAYMLVNAFAKFGAGACLMRADFDIDALAPTMVTVSLLSATVSAELTFVFARDIAIALGSPDGAGPVRVIALVLFLEGFSSIPWTQLSRDFRQDRQFWANAVSLIPSQVVLILLAKSGYGAMAFAWSTAVNQAITAVMLIIYAPTKYLPGFARSALSPLFRFGIPLAGAGLINYVLLNVDYVFIGHLIGPVQLGVYMLAFSVASWPVGLIGGAVTAVTMPAFSRIKHDPDLLKNALVSAMRVASVIVMPICAFMVVLARPVVLTLYGARWSASAEVLSILALYSAMSIICTFFGTILSSLGRTKVFVAVQLVWLGALVPAMVFGIRHGGINGAAQAHVVVIGLLVLPSYAIALKRATGVRLAVLVGASLPGLLAASAAAVVARTVATQLGSPPLRLVAGLAAGGLVYMVAAGQQVAVGLLGPAQLARLRALRAFRVYESTFRLLKLSGRGQTGGYYRGRHSANRTSAEDRPQQADTANKQQPAGETPRADSSRSDTMTAPSTAPL